MRYHIGMSGWTFPGWRGAFYPKGLPAKKELEYASQQVTSIEVNGTFYRVQSASSFQNWYRATPKDFVFSLKAPKFITHVRRLKEVESAVANFLASGVFCLKEKLGAILWQFPPFLSLKDDRFEKFAKWLPKSPQAAALLSEKHSDWLKGKAVVSSKGVRQIQHAFEFRHPSFFNQSFLQMLREHGIAVVFAHGGKQELFTETVTANFLYCRMHGEGKKYSKGYSKTVLTKWASTLQGLAAKHPEIKDAYLYFDTEEKVYSPLDAKKLLQILR